MHPFKKGFVRKCAEYGLDKEAAKELFNKIAQGTPEDWIDQIGKGGDRVATTNAALAKKPTPPAAPAKPAPVPLSTNPKIPMPANKYYNPNPTYTPSDPSKEPKRWW